MSDADDERADFADVPDDYLQCEWMPRDAIEPNDWNPNEMGPEDKEHLFQSIVNHGWTRPIVIHAEEHYIIDGEQRWTVARRQEIQEDEDLTPPDVPAGYVPVYGITMDENEAKISTIQHNRVRGFIDYTSLYEYLGEFEQKDMLDEVAGEIDLSHDAVERIVDQEEVADAVGGAKDELEKAWEPVDIRELDDSETVADSSSAAMREADRDEDVDRITVQFPGDTRSATLDYLTDEHSADNLYRLCRAVIDNGLVEEFREYAAAYRDNDYIHPEHDFFGVNKVDRPSGWDDEAHRPDPEEW